jgi:hypothetical protein
MPNFMSIRQLVREVTRKVSQADEGAWEVRPSLKANVNNLVFPCRIAKVTSTFLTA